MYAIEFSTKVKDGIIEIPPDYRHKLKEQVKVIVLAEEEAKEGLDMVEYLMKNPLKVASFKPLRREEIYDRR